MASGTRLGSCDFGVQKLVWLTLCAHCDWWCACLHLKTQHYFYEGLLFSQDKGTFYCCVSCSGC